jgi:hypothetical protein
MDPMEIMMKMTGFSMPQIENEKKKKKRKVCSSPLGYNVSRKTSSLILPTRNSQLTALHSSLVLIRLTRSSILQRQLSRAHFTFTSLHENNPRNTCISQLTHISNLIRINHVIL